MANSSEVKFERPPIIELVLGVQFDRINELSSGHCGWFWKRYLGEEWVKGVDAFPIVDQLEKFGDQPREGISDLSVFLSQGASFPRFQISTATGDRMIQVQRTRFHYNWQKKGDAYPSYHQVRKEFDQNLEKFRRFIVEAKLGELQPNQWEITYVNHIPKGELWGQPKHWHKVVPGLLATNSEMEEVFLEGIGGEWHFEIRPEKGRVHVGVQYGRPGDKAEPTLILNTTARGPINKAAGLDLNGGLDLGHKKILQTFLQITSPEAQKFWKRVDQ